MAELAIVVIAVGLASGSIFGLLAFRRLRLLERDIGQLRTQISRLGGVAGDETTPAEAMAELRKQQAPDADPAQPEPVAPTSQAPSRSRQTHRGHERIAQLEAHLKDNWMVWLGGLCIGLAGIFLVRYSIEQGILGPAARVGLGIATGLALHAAAEFLRRRDQGSHAALAALAGGASIMLFAALLAALHLYQLIAPGPAFALLALVAMGTMLLALWHGPVLAIIGILGAYLVPALVSDGSGAAVIALVYALIVSAAALTLIRHVYRSWLWWGVLAGGLGWWAITLWDAGASDFRGLYLALFAWGLLAIPSRNWLLASDMDSGPVQSRALLAGLLLLCVTLAISVALAGYSASSFTHWAPLSAVLILAGRCHPSLALVPWCSLLLQWLGWLASTLDESTGTLQLTPLATEVQASFAFFALAMSILYSALAGWSSRQVPGQHALFSLACLAPVAWLALAYLLVSELSADWQWSVLAVCGGLVYAILSRQQLARSESNSRAAWMILAAHLAYSLAASMLLEQATLTLALALQAPTLALLARRFSLPGISWLMKGLLALILARLALNPWLLSYPVDLHWSLWTYGGSTLSCALAARLLGADHALRPWLEAVSVQLLVLFIAAETRYQLYDGAIFSAEYSLTEAAINTLSWACLGLLYHYRATLSEHLGAFYRTLGSVLILAGGLNYLLCLLTMNPWWSGESIGTTPLWNVLLPAYGLPALLILLAIPRLPESWRQSALALAGAGLFVFVNLEIRHLWQGQVALSNPTPEGELYTYSLVWLLAASACIMLARRWAQETLYKLGNLIMLIVVVKLFLVDMSGLEGLWRVASFMGLGLALLGLAYLYRRGGQEDLAEPPSTP